MTTLEQYIEERLEDPEFAEEWEKSEPEYLVKLALIEARKSEGLTQQELASAAGMNQATISKIESGITQPTIPTLAKIAKGMNKRLEVRFV